MKALVKAKAEPGIWMEEVKEPELGTHDLLIKTKKTAICGTDVHIYQWDAWAQEHIRTPLITGHEFVGEIVEIGKEVTHAFRIGDRVSGEGHIACQQCRNCLAGRAHLCRANISLGVTRSGCFAEYFCLPAINAYAIPESVPDHLACLLDPLGNATHTALSFDLVGEDVLITGAGPIGLMAAVIARQAGARYIVITDINEYRLNLAKKLGVNAAIHPNHTSLKTIMQELNMKEGFDIGLEVSGKSQAFNSMITHMNHAGKIALLGFLPPNTEVNWSQFIMKGLIIKGIYGREMFETWYKMIAMLQSGLKIEPILTHELPITEYQQAFDIMALGQCGKVVMNWSLT